MIVDGGPIGPEPTILQWVIKPGQSEVPKLLNVKVLKHVPPVTEWAAFVAIFEMIVVRLNVPDKSTRVAGGECIQKDTVKFIADERGPIEGIPFVRHRHSDGLLRRTF
jgi:hypothetical protein